MLRASLLVSIVVALVACDELLPPGDWTSPQYWADYFLDKYEDELVVGDLEPGPTPLAAPRTVLLVTGVTIPARWFDPIVARLQRDGFDPVVYEPPELLSYDLYEASEDLAAVVEQLVEETGQERIDILAECTGGVIARYYIQSLGGDAYIDRMVTFVSPQHGVGKAPLAAMYAGWPALFDLSPGSDFLTDVNEAPLPENVAFTSIYTCTDAYIQPYETSIIPGANNIGLCDGVVDHFQTFYDPDIYLIMHGALTEPLAGETDDFDDAPSASDPTEENHHEHTPPGTVGAGDDPLSGSDPAAAPDDFADPAPAGTPAVEVAEPAGASAGDDSAGLVGCSATGSAPGPGHWLGALLMGLWLVRREREGVKKTAGGRA